MPNFATFTSLLLKQLHKAQFEEIGSVTEEKPGALERYEEKLISVTVPTLTRINEQYILDTDVCDR